GAAAMVAFHFLLLVVPTTLMGLSLPLLARGVVGSPREIAPLVGRLYAVNTLGAAAGAAIAGWWLMGEYGFVATVRVAAALDFGAAAVVLRLWWLEHRRVAADAIDPAKTGERSSEVDAPTAAAATADSSTVWPWLALYALTGAVAIGLEVVYFRVIDAVMRNNSYTFASVL